MTEENPYEPQEEYQTPVEVKLSYSDWLSIVNLTGEGKISMEEGGYLTDKDKEARERFLMALERPPEVENPITKYGLEDAIRKDMAGLIPEFQEEIDDDTVYCEKCDGEYDFTPSVLSVHNLRRHEWADDLYDLQDRECSNCGSIGGLRETTGHCGTEGLIECSGCGELQ